MMPRLQMLLRPRRATALMPEGSTLGEVAATKAVPSPMLALQNPSYKNSSSNAHGNNKGKARSKASVRIQQMKCKTEHMYAPHLFDMLWLCLAFFNRIHTLHQIALTLTFTTCIMMPSGGLWTAPSKQWSMAKQTGQPQTLGLACSFMCLTKNAPNTNMLQLWDSQRWWQCQPKTQNRGKTDKSCCMGITSYNNAKTIELCTASNPTRNLCVVSSCQQAIQTMCYMKAHQTTTCFPADGPCCCQGNLLKYCFGAFEIPEILSRNPMFINLC